MIYKTTLGGMYMKFRKSLFMIFSFLFVVSAVNGLAYGKSRASGSILTSPRISVNDVKSSQIVLKWGKVNGAKEYRIYMAVKDNKNYKSLGRTTALSYKNSGLKPNTTYWFYVTAYNSSGSYKTSAHLKIVTKPAAATQAPKTVLGFATHYYAGDSSSYSSLVANTSMINQLVTATYSIDSHGNLIGDIPLNQVNYAKEHKIKALVMVSNNSDYDTLKNVLDNQFYRHNFINSLLLTLMKSDYNGVSINFQNIPRTDQDNFTSLMKELYTTLHPKGYMISINLPPKTLDTATESNTYGYDFKALGAYCDSAVIMALDEHDPSGMPGPIASINWIKAVLDYSTKVIPSNRILLGVGAYGYDWSATGVRGYGVEDINDIASTYSAAILWDKVSESPYFTYKDNLGQLHSIWFENDRSLSYKLALVKSMNLGGIALNRLGLENHDFWNKIKTDLK